MQEYFGAFVILHTENVHAIPMKYQFVFHFSTLNRVYLDGGGGRGQTLGQFILDLSPEFIFNLFTVYLSLSSV